MPLGSSLGLLFTSPHEAGLVCMLGLLAGSRFHLEKLPKVALSDLSCLKEIIILQLYK